MLHRPQLRVCWRAVGECAALLLWRGWWMTTMFEGLALAARNVFPFVVRHGVGGWSWSDGARRRRSLSSSSSIPRGDSRKEEEVISIIIVRCVLVCWWLMLTLNPYIVLARSRETRGITSRSCVWYRNLPIVPKLVGCVDFIDSNSYVIENNVWYI